MRMNAKIITICGQSLKNIKGATRAYNMYKTLERQGVKVTYLDGWKPSYKFKYQNINNWLRLFFFSLFNKDSKFIFIENVMNPFYLKIIKRLRLPIVLDVRDDYNLHAESMKIKIPQKTILERELAQIENFDSAKKILVTSKRYIEYYSKKYDCQFDKKFIPIENATDHRKFYSKPLPTEPRIGYLGGANEGAGIDLLIHAAKIIKNKMPELTLHIGYTTMKETEEYMATLRKQHSDDWIYYYDDISYSHNAADFLSSMLICVIPRKNFLHLALTTPSKLFDTMAAGRPLVVTNCEVMAGIVNQEKCGLVCDFTPEDMAKKISKLLNDRELAEAMGKNGRRAVEERHNWDVRVNKIMHEQLIRSEIFKSEK